MDVLKRQATQEAAQRQAQQEAAQQSQQSGRVETDILKREGAKKETAKVSTISDTKKLRAQRESAAASAELSDLYTKAQTQYPAIDWGYYLQVAETAGGDVKDNFTKLYNDFDKRYKDTSSGIDKKAVSTDPIDSAWQYIVVSQGKLDEYKNTMLSGIKPDAKLILKGDLSGVVGTVKQDITSKYKLTGQSWPTTQTVVSKETWDTLMKDPVTLKIYQEKYGTAFKREDTIDYSDVYKEAQSKYPYLNWDAIKENLSKYGLEYKIYDAVKELDTRNAELDKLEAQGAKVNRDIVPHLTLNGMETAAVIGSNPMGGVNYMGTQVEAAGYKFPLASYEDILEAVRAENPKLAGYETSAIAEAVKHEFENPITASAIAEMRQTTGFGAGEVSAAIAAGMKSGMSQQEAASQVKVQGVGGFLASLPPENLPESAKQYLETHKGAKEAALVTGGYGLSSTQIAQQLGLMPQVSAVAPKQTGKLDEVQKNNFDRSADRPELGINISQKNIDIVNDNLAKDPTFLNKLTTTLVNPVTGEVTAEGEAIGLQGKVFNRPVGIYSTFAATGLAEIETPDGIAQIFQNVNDPLGGNVVWMKGSGGSSLGTISWDKDKPYYTKNLNKTDAYAAVNGIESTWNAVKDAVDANGNAKPNNILGLEGHVVFSKLGDYVAPTSSQITWGEFVNKYPQLGLKYEGVLAQNSDYFRSLLEEKPQDTLKSSVVDKLKDRFTVNGVLDYAKAGAVASDILNKIDTLYESGLNADSQIESKYGKTTVKEFISAYTDVAAPVKTTITPVTQVSGETIQGIQTLIDTVKANKDANKATPNDIQISSITEKYTTRDKEGKIVEVNWLQIKSEFDANKIDIPKPQEVKPSEVTLREPSGFGYPVEAGVLYPTIRVGTAEELGGPTGGGYGVKFSGVGEVDYGGNVGKKEVNVDYFVTLTSDGKISTLWWKEPNTRWFEGDYKYLPNQDAVTGVVCRGKTCQLHEDDLNIGVKYILSQGIEKLRSEQPKPSMPTPTQVEQPTQKTVVPLNMKDDAWKIIPYETQKKIVYNPDPLAEFNKWVSGDVIVETINIDGIPIKYESVKLSDGTNVSKTILQNLGTTYSTILKTQGWEGLKKYWDEHNVKLADGNFIDIDEFNSLSDQEKKDVRDKGLSTVYVVDKDKNFIKKSVYNNLSDEEKRVIQSDGLRQYYVNVDKRYEAALYKMRDYKDENGYYPYKYAIDANNSGESYSKIEQTLRDARFSNDTINGLRNVIPPDGYASNKELNNMTPAQRVDYIKTHADDIRLLPIGFLDFPVGDLRREQLKAKYLEGLTVEQRAKEDMRASQVRDWQTAMAYKSINDNPNIPAGQKVQLLKDVAVGERTENILKWSETVPKLPTMPEISIDRNAYNLVATVNPWLKVLDVGQQVTGIPGTISDVAYRLGEIGKPSHEPEAKIAVYDAQRNALTTGFWSQDQLEEFNKNYKEWTKKLYTFGGNVKPEVAEGIATGALFVPELSLNAVRMIWDMGKQMGGVIPLTVMMAGEYANRNETDKAAFELAQLTGGMVAFPVVQGADWIGEASKGKFSKVGGQTLGMGITFVMSPAHLAKAGVRGIVGFGDITIDNGKVLIPKAVSKSSWIPYLEVPKAYYKLIDELKGIYADEATVKRIMGMKDPVKQADYVQSLLSAESRPVWEAGKQLVELAWEHGEVPKAWQTDKVDFSIVKDMPKGVSEDLRQVFQANKNNGYIKGSFADVSQITNNVLKALIGDQYGRVGDVDYVVTGNIKAKEIANQVVGAINKRLGKDYAKVVGTDDNAKVIISGGKGGGTFQIHTVGKIGQAKPFGWEKQFSLVEVDGIKMANFRDQLLRRGDIMLYPSWEEFAGTFGQAAETAISGERTTTQPQRGLKDWFRLKYQVDMVVEKLKAEGKTDIAKQIEDNLDIFESGIKKTYKAGGTKAPTAIKEKTLVLTPESRQELIDVMNVLQEVTVAEGIDSYFVTPEGTIYRYTTASEKLLPNTLYHVTDDIRPYQRLADKGETLKPGYILDENGNLVEAPADQIFLSPQAAIAYLDETKTPHGGIVALRATGIDRAKYLNPAFRTEVFPQAKFTTVDIFGKKINIGGEKDLQLVFDEWVWGKEGEAKPLGEKYAVRAEDALTEWPVVWFAMEDAVKQGIGIPDVDTIKAINSLAWKQSLTDFMYPHLNKNIQVVFDPSATGKGGLPVSFYKDSWQWKNLTPEKIAQIQEQEKLRLSRQTINKLGAELQQIINKGDDVGSELKQISQDVLQGKANIISKYIEDRVRVLNNATASELQTIIRDVNKALAEGKSVNADASVILNNAEQTLKNGLQNIKDKSGQVDAKLAVRLLTELQNQIRAEQSKLKGATADTANKALDAIVTNISEKAVKLDKLQEIGSKDVYVWPEDASIFAEPKDLDAVLSINNRGAVLSKVRSALTDESRQVWDALFQLTENLYRNVRAEPSFVSYVPNVNLKEIFTGRFTDETSGKVKSILQKYNRDGFTAGSFADYLQLHGQRLPEYMKPKDIDIELWEDSNIKAEDVGLELFKAMVDIGDEVELYQFTEGRHAGVEQYAAIDIDGNLRLKLETYPDNSAVVSDFRFNPDGEVLFDIHPSGMFKNEMLLKDWAGQKNYVNVDGITIADIRNQILDRGTILLTPAYEFLPTFEGELVKMGKSGAFGSYSETATKGEPTGVRLSRKNKDWNRYKYEANYFIDKIEEAGNKPLAQALRDRLEIASEGVKTTFAEGGTKGGLMNQLGFIKLPKLLYEEMEKNTGKITKDYLINLADLSRIYYTQLSPTLEESAQQPQVTFTVIPEGVTKEDVENIVSKTLLQTSSEYGQTSQVFIQPTPIPTKQVTIPPTSPKVTTTPQVTTTTIPTKTTSTTTPTTTTTTTITTTTPTTPPTPPSPPSKKVPQVLVGKSATAWEDLTSEQQLASIVWKQGFTYWACTPPAYNQNSLIHSPKPFPGVKIYHGPKSAYKSVARVKGADLPERIDLDLGIMDITFQKDKDGNDVKIYYRADPKQLTTGQGPTGYPQSQVRIRRHTSAPQTSVVK